MVVPDLIGSNAIDDSRNFRANNDSPVHVDDNSPAGVLFNYCLKMFV